MPQCSVLEPLIFLLFINASILVCILVLSVDDTSMAIKANSLLELKNLFESVFECLMHWCNRNTHVVNLAKTQIVKFQTRTTQVSHSFVVLHWKGNLISTVLDSMGYMLFEVWSEYIMCITSILVKNWIADLMFYSNWRKFFLNNGVLLRIVILNFKQ